MVEKTIRGNVFHYANFRLIKTRALPGNRGIYRSTETLSLLKKMVAVMLEVIMCLLLVVSACLMVMGI
jgi:hypothetical protein